MAQGLLDRMSDSAHRVMQGLSEKMFNWTPAQHAQAAQYAEQRAQELRQQQADSASGKTLLKNMDFSGRIKDLQDVAAYHRSKAQGTQADDDSDGLKSAIEQTRPFPK